MNLILHLNKNNLFNFNYLQQNIYPITISSNIYLTDTNFKFGNFKYKNSNYYLKNKIDIDEFNKWIVFLDYYINKRKGYLYNTINTLNLEKQLIVINNDLEYLNYNLQNLQNKIDTQFSNIKGTDAEFTQYLQQYYNDVQNKNDENPFIIIPICITPEYAESENGYFLNYYKNGFKYLAQYFKEGLSINNKIYVDCLSNLFTGDLVTDNYNKIIQINNEFDFNLRLGTEEFIEEPYITKCLPYYNNIFNKYLIFALVTYENWYRQSSKINVLTYLTFNIISYVCIRLNKNVNNFDNLTIKGFSTNIENDILKKCSVNLLNYTKAKLCDYEFMDRNNWELISYYV